jgi:hypothetical protein
LSLVGDCRREHLFTLRQSVTAYRHCQHLMASCDAEIGQMLAEFSDRVEDGTPPLPPSPKHRQKPRRNELRFDLRGHLYRIFGVDLTQVPGINALTAHVLHSRCSEASPRSVTTIAGCGPG